MDAIASSSDISADNPLAGAINNKMTNRSKGTVVTCNMKVDRADYSLPITETRANIVLLKFELQEFCRF